MRVRNKVTVDEVMTSPVHSLHAGWSLREAAHNLLERGFGGAPVVDEDNDVVGVLTLQDIARYAEWHLDAEELTAEIEQEREALRELDSKERGLKSTMHVDRLENATVRQVMTSDVSSVEEGTLLEEATSILLEGPIHRLFVTGKNGKLVGLISTMDIVRYLHEEVL